jgi:hypothetical protein
MTPQQHALYRFYDSTGRLLYVGITLDPGSRWKNHAKTKPWWTDVAQVTVELHPDRAAVLEAERAAIIAEQPVHNVVHNRGRATPTRATTSAKPTAHGPYTEDQNLWTFAGRHGFQRTMPLYLGWEVNCSAVSDDFDPDETDEFQLLDYWARRYGEDQVPIYWSILPIYETAPHQAHPSFSSDFLTYYTWPHHPDTGELLNFLRLPVVDKAWTHEQADKGGFIQQATGWKPSALQPYVATAQLFAAAGMARPTLRKAAENHG